MLVFDMQVMLAFTCKHSVYERYNDCKTYFEQLYKFISVQKVLIWFRLCDFESHFGSPSRW